MNTQGMIGCGFVVTTALFMVFLEPWRIVPQWRGWPTLYSVTFLDQPPYRRVRAGDQYSDISLGEEALKFMLTGRAGEAVQWPRPAIGVPHSFSVEQIEEALNAVEQDNDRWRRKVPRYFPHLPVKQRAALFACELRTYGTTYAVRGRSRYGRWQELTDEFRDRAARAKAAWETRQ